jgi:hypothetical protein
MGYSIDDVARALIVVNHAVRLFPSLDAPAATDTRTLGDLAVISLRFLETFQRPDGRFHNFVSAEGTPRDPVGSEDSFGRTLWALGDTMAFGITREQRTTAALLFQKASPHLLTSHFLRTNAFLIVGLTRALSVHQEPLWRTALIQLLKELIEHFRDSSGPGWKWFENNLRYSNGVLPFALFLGAEVVSDIDRGLSLEARSVAQQSLDFLLQEAQHEGVPAPIGNNGWYERGKTKALFDQQPVDAAAMVLACVEASRHLGEQRYRDQGEAWLRWYEGNNVLQQPLLEDDGSVHDGLSEGGVNQNRGAEAVVTYLLARLHWIEFRCRC